MKPNNQESIEDLFPFYALGNLSDEERDLVEKYLEENPVAQEQLEEMIEAASVLALAVDPIKPRDQLTVSLLNRIRTEPYEARDEAYVRRGPIGWWARNRVTAAIALASLLIATLSATWALSLNADILQLKSELVGLDATIVQQNEIITRMSMPGVQAVDVLATSEGSGAGGRLFTDPEASSGVLFAWGLTPLSPEESYQVWLIAGENPVSAGLLPMQDQGRSVHLIDASSSLESFDAIGISIEPFGGSDLPIGPIVLFAGLTD